MRHEVRFAGFGGQGVVKAALLLCLAAGLHDDREVAQTQSYGPEARGGACRSEVVISDEPIDYLKPIKIDCLVVMSQPALDKYAVDLDPAQSLVVADSTLVTDLPPGLERVVKIEATATAEQEFGQALFANIIMLGALAAVTDLTGLGSLAAALQGNVPPATLETNRRALERGFELGRAAAGASRA